MLASVLQLTAIAPRPFHFLSILIFILFPLSNFTFGKNESIKNTCTKSVCLRHKNTKKLAAHFGLSFLVGLVFMKMFNYFLVGLSGPEAQKWPFWWAFLWRMIHSGHIEEVKQHMTLFVRPCTKPNIIMFIMVYTRANRICHAIILWKLQFIHFYFT